LEEPESKPFLEEPSHFKMSKLNERFSQTRRTAQYWSFMDLMAFEHLFPIN
jgi:hypothetical protein